MSLYLLTDMSTLPVQNLCFPKTVAVRGRERGQAGAKQGAGGLPARKEGGRAKAPHQLPAGIWRGGGEGHRQPRPRLGQVIFIAIFIYYCYYYYYSFFFGLVQSTGGLPGGMKRTRTSSHSQTGDACAPPPPRRTGTHWGSGGALLMGGNLGADTAPTNNLKKRWGGGAVKGAPGWGHSGAAPTQRPHPAGPQWGKRGARPPAAAPPRRPGRAACAGRGTCAYRPPPKLSSSSGRGSASQHVMSISGGRGSGGVSGWCGVPHGGTDTPPPLSPLTWGFVVEDGLGGFGRWLFRRGHLLLLGLAEIALTGLGGGLCR